MVIIIPATVSSKHTEKLDAHKLSDKQRRRGGNNQSFLYKEKDEFFRRTDFPYEAASS